MTYLLVAGLALCFAAHLLFGGRIRRRRDMRTLWPIVKEESGELDVARIVFLAHMGASPHWRELCDDFDEEQMGNWVRENLT